MDKRAKTNLTIIAVSLVCMVLGAIFGWARANKPSRDYSVEPHSATESSEYKSTTKDSTNNSTTTDSDEASVSSDTTNGTNNGTTSSNKNNEDTYDDGYDDVYMDGEYDVDRYSSDEGYATGVDDAMEEEGEDW